MNREHFLTVISGPSGSGKDSVVREMIAAHPEIECSVSATTRAPREGEEHGVHYFFLSKNDFEQCIAENKLIEHTQYVENYYGTLRSQIEDRMNRKVACVLVIEVEGAANVKRQYPGCVTVFIKPPNMQELENRLRSRGTEEEACVQKRLQRAKEELQLAEIYDHVLINEECGHCANSLYEIIKNSQESAQATEIVSE